MGIYMYTCMYIYVYIHVLFCLGVGFEILNQREHDETKTHEMFFLHPEMDGFQSARSPRMKATSLDFLFPSALC